MSQQKEIKLNKIERLNAILGRAVRDMMIHIEMASEVALTPKEAQIGVESFLQRMDDTDWALGKSTEEQMTMITILSLVHNSIAKEKSQTEFQFA
jgi:hypothetical protein